MTASTMFNSWLRCSIAWLFVCCTLATVAAGKDIFIKVRLQLVCVDH